MASLFIKPEQKKKKKILYAELFYIIKMSDLICVKAGRYIRNKRANLKEEWSRGAVKEHILKILVKRCIQLLSVL